MSGDELKEIRERKLSRMIKEANEMSKIIVYGTTACPYCVLAKKYLDEKKVEYEYVDVSIDKERAKEMIEKSGQMGVPVLEVNGTIIVGFDKAKIDSALG